MREIAAVICCKTEEFEKAEKAYPKQFVSDKKKALAMLQRAVLKLAKAKTVEQTRQWHELDWKERKELFPSPPVLRVCDEKHALELLERDVREVVPINSNSDLWEMLQSKCEIIQVK
jgi:uncharacterized protein (DUF1499 family)